MPCQPKGPVTTRHRSAHHILLSMSRFPSPDTAARRVHCFAVPEAPFPVLACPFCARSNVTGTPGAGRSPRYQAQTALLPGRQRVPRRARGTDELERRPGAQKLLDFFLRPHIQVKMFDVADALPDAEVPVARGKRLRRVFGWVHWLSSPGIGPHRGDLAGCQGVADFRTDAGLSSVTLGLILLALLRGLGIALPETIPAGPEQHHSPWLASAMPCASKAA